MVARSDNNDPRNDVRHDQQLALGAAQAMTAAAVRDASFSTAVEPEEFVLSDDSITQSPQKPQRSRERYRSGSGPRKSGTPRTVSLTRRSVSSGAKRGLPRPPSPALVRELVKRPRAVVPQDATPEARLAALEEQRNNDHAILEEMATAVRSLQDVVGHLQAKTTSHEAQSKEQVQIGMQLRKELYVVRDQLAGGVSAAAKTAEESAVANMAPVIEAKFAQLDGFLVQLQAGLATLGAREDRVEQVVQAQHDGKPQQEEIISGAFGHMDQKISQVSELVRKFDGTLISSSTPSAVFTRAMQLDMEKMHSQLNGITANISAIDNIHEQLAEARVKFLSQDECLSNLEAKIVAHTEALTTLHSAATGGAGILQSTSACTTCGPPTASANPWSHTPAAPGIPGAGLPGSSGEGDPLGILRAVIGGNQACHCIHVTELQDKVATLERAAIARAAPTRFTPDPWSRGHAGADGAPEPRGSQIPTTENGAPAGASLPLQLHGPLGAIAHKDRPVFDQKMTLQEEFKFNGVKDGMKWKDKVERYFISCAPVLLDVLVWAERQDNDIITSEKFQYALSRTMTVDQVLNLNAALWGFLSCVVSGSADTMFKRATRLNGIDAWRRLVRHIDHGRELRLNDLRREMKQRHLRPMKNLQEVEQGVAEYENAIHEYEKAGATAPTEKEMKDDLLAILPERMQADLLWNATDRNVSFDVFRDHVVTQSARLLAIQRPGRPIQGVEDESPALNCRLPDGVDSSDISLFENVTNTDELIAAFQKMNSRRPQTGTRASTATSTSTRTSTAPRSTETQRRPRKCPNCGEEHEARVCPKPPVAIADRKCWGCGRPGHSSRQCPDRNKGIRAIEDGSVNNVSHLNGFFMVDNDGYQLVQPRAQGRRPHAAHEHPRRPTPSTATVADFISKNTFEILGIDEAQGVPSRATRTSSRSPPSATSRAPPSTTSRAPPSTTSRAPSRTAPAAPPLKRPESRGISINEPVMAKTRPEHGGEDRHDHGHWQGKDSSSLQRASEAPKSSGIAMTTAASPKAVSSASRPAATGTAEPRHRGTPVTRHPVTIGEAVIPEHGPSPGASEAPNGITMSVHSLITSLNSPTEASTLGKNLGLNSPEREHVFKSSIEDELQLASGPCGECGVGNPPPPTSTPSPKPRAARREAAKAYKAAIKDAENIIGGIHCVVHDRDDENIIAHTVEQVKVRVAMDSAAVDNVIHPRALPEDIDYEPNDTGKHFVGANDAHIERYGTCQTVLTSDKGDVGCQWQMADVSRALHSVARVTGPKDGPGKQDVLFDNERCVVVPPGTVKRIMKTINAVAEYEREGNLYIAEMLMSRFPRQGNKE